MAESRKKKTAPAKKTASEKKAPAKKTAEKAAETKKAETKPAEEKKKVKRDPTGKSTSVLLFAAGVLLGVMFFVEGTSGWKIMHEIFHGLFGYAALAVPVTLLYSAIAIGRDKSNEKTGVRIFCGMLITFLLSTALQIFLVGEVPEGTLLEAASHMFHDAKSDKGGGAAAFPLAYFLLRYMGKLGARVLMLVALFVLVMFMTGSGMNDLFRMMGKPVKLAGNGLKGVKNLLDGMEFSDDYIDDDNIDDDREKRSFEKDIEAVGILEEPQPVPEPVHDRNIVFSQPVQNSSADDGFIMDIQLPTDDRIPAPDDDFEIFPDKKPEPVNIAQEKDDSSLDDLITKAANSKKTAVSDDELPPFDMDEEPEKEKEPELPA